MGEALSGSDLFNDLAHEFVERHRRGERPSPGEYAERYPDPAGEIRELFPTLVMMERLGVDEEVPRLTAAGRPIPQGPMPDRLGDYRILREIGRGGMGVVYEAVQESLGRRTGAPMAHLPIGDCDEAAFLPDGDLLTYNVRGLCRWPARRLSDGLGGLGPPGPLAGVAGPSDWVLDGLAVSASGRLVGACSPKTPGVLRLDPERPRRRTWLVSHATIRDVAIKLNSALPAISTNAAIIDGYSQPGAAENTLAQGDNAKPKIAISGAGVGTINGLTIGQPGSQVRGLDIGDFAGRGAVVTAAANVQVAGCFIGTDPTGETAAPNVTGLVIENSSNLIGGPNVGDRNLISGNSQDGLDVPDQAANPLNIEPTGNRIENNDIGIDAAGTKALGNVGQGVDGAGSGDTYGGTAAGLGNVISGNQSSGLVAGGSVTVEGNDIGTGPTGNVALGNRGFGIDAAQDLGGAPLLSVIITNNVVSGNVGNGISATQIFRASPATYTIANNLIGTDAAGTAAMGNGQYGIFLGYVKNCSILNNVISANEMGLRFSGSASDVDQGNLIGTDETGQVALGNTMGGIILSEATGITIGGTEPGQGNVIADNGGIGIEEDGGQQNLITHNSIFGNTSVGIYLGPQVGQSVPAPVLTFTPGSGPTGTLSGTLKASPNVAYTIEIFSVPSPTAAGPDQGETFVQDVTVTTDGSGKGSFSVAEPVGYYAVTATDPSGNTSRFSSVVGSQALAATQTAVSSSSNASTVGQPLTFTAVVTAPAFQGTPTGTVTFTIDGQAQAPVSLSVVGGVDQAQFTTSTLAAGPHTVSAEYSGDANVGASGGSLPTQSVNAPSLRPTTTSLASSSSPSASGQPLTFTAVVSAGTSAETPTGTITFTVDGTAEAPVALQVGPDGDQATFSISTLTVGTHTIGATYNGDSTFAASTVPTPLTQTVNAPAPSTNPLATSTTIASSKDPSGVGVLLTFTATVASSAAAVAPTGMVTFTIDGVVEPAVPLRAVDGRDQATFSISTLTPGTHTIGASYGGDATYAASAVASPLTQTVIAQSRPAPTPIAVPPVVASVKRYGIHGQPTVLTFTFSAALDPARAQDIHNYRITDPSGRSVRIRPVVYDPAADAVTLRPRRRINLHLTYDVAVTGTGAGGVADARGVSLDGDGDDKAGSDFVSKLNWKNAVLTPAETERRLPRWLFKEHAAAFPVPPRVGWRVRCA